MDNLEEFEYYKQKLDQMESEKENEYGNSLEDVERRMSIYKYFF